MLLMKQAATGYPSVPHGSIIQPGNGLFYTYIIFSAICQERLFAMIIFINSILLEMQTVLPL